LINTNDLVSMFNNWKIWTLSSEDLMWDNCSAISKDWASVQLWF
jgi:hypothetical protein